MSFSIQKFKRRIGQVAFVCLFLSVGVSFAQEVAEEPMDEAAVVEDQDEDDVEEGEVVAAAQVVGVMGMDANKMTAAKRFQLTQIFLVEIEEAKQVCELDKKQVLKLRIGSKGAVKKLTAEWKKNAQGQMGGMMQQVQNEDGENDQEQEDSPDIEFKDADEIDENTMQMVVMNGMGNPFKYDDPLEHRFWQTTLKNILTDAQSEKLKKFKLQRKTAKKNAMINLAISALTVELGLTDQQKVKLTEVITPPMEKAEISCFAFYEPFVLYYYASKADSKKLKEVLSPAQLQKWKIFVMPVKQVGEMMEMEAGNNVIEEEEGILILLGQAIEAIAEGAEALLSVYSK